MIKILLDNIDFEISIKNNYSWGSIILLKKYAISKEWLGLLNFVLQTELNYSATDSDKKIVLSCITFNTISPGLIEGQTKQYTVTIKQLDENSNQLHIQFIKK